MTAWMYICVCLYAYISLVIESKTFILICVLIEMCSHVNAFDSCMTCFHSFYSQVAMESRVKQQRRLANKINNKIKIETNTHHHYQNAIKCFHSRPFCCVCVFVCMLVLVKYAYAKHTYHKFIIIHIDVDPWKSSAYYAFAISFLFFLSSISHKYHCYVQLFIFP